MTTTQHTPIDASRHEGQESSAKGDPTGIDFQEELEAAAAQSPFGLLGKVWDAIVAVGSPKERPNVINLGDDEQAHRIVSTSALLALGEAVERLIVSLPKRVEVAGSDRVTAQQTSVGIGSPATVLVGRQIDRLRVTIRNDDSSNSIFIGTGPELTTATGFEIEADTERTIETRAALYAVAAVAVVNVSLLIEFGDLG